MFQSTLSCFFPVFFPLCTALLIFTNQEWLSKANSKCFYKLLNCQEESFVFHFKWITLIETFHEYIKSKVASLRSRYFACLKGFKDYLRLYFHVSGFKDSGFFCSGKKGTKIEKFVLKRANLSTWQGCTVSFTRPFQFLDNINSTAYNQPNSSFKHVNKLGLFLYVEFWSRRLQFKVQTIQGE
jgi:hypothetical protein